MWSFLWPFPEPVEIEAIMAQVNGVPTDLAGKEHLNFILGCVTSYIITYSNTVYIISAL
jgi:hypothetical protein